MDLINLYDRILLLKKTALFADVNTEDLRMVVMEMKYDHYVKGETVFLKGEPSNHIMVIESGLVGIYIDSNKEYITQLGPGECLGEMGVFDNLPRSASAEVIEDTNLLSLDKSKLYGLISRYPELSFGLLQSLSIRLRKMNEKISV